MPSADLIIPIGDIARLRPIKWLGILPNQLEVTVRSGKAEKFMLSQPAEWTARFNRLKS